MLARHRQGDSKFTGGRDHLDFAAEGLQLEAGRHFCLLLEAEADDAMSPCQFLPQRRMRVVGVDHGDTVSGQTLENLSLGASHRLHRAQTRQMGGLGIDDQRHIGPGDPGQIGDLARMVHAHLDHGVAMGSAQSEQRQRHADVVIQVALGREHLLDLASLRSQDRGNHFLHRGLAAAAGERHHGNGEAAAPVTGQLTQSKARILDNQQTGNRPRPGRAALPARRPRPAPSPA